MLEYRKVMRRDLFNSSQLTAHSSQLTAHSSQLTAHSSQQLTAHSSQLTAHSSQLTAHSSQLTAHSSQLTAHSLAHYARNNLSRPPNKTNRPIKAVYQACPKTTSSKKLFFFKQYITNQPYRQNSDAELGPGPCSGTEVSGPLSFTIPMPRGQPPTSHFSKQ